MSTDYVWAAVVAEYRAKRETWLVALVAADREGTEANKAAQDHASAESQASTNAMVGYRVGSLPTFAEKFELVRAEYRDFDVPAEVMDELAADLSGLLVGRA